MSNICLQNTRYKLKSVSTSLAGITEASDHMKASSNSDENSSAVKVTRTSQLTNLYVSDSHRSSRYSKENAKSRRNDHSVTYRLLYGHKISSDL
jgi:hypothetical protein